MEIADKPVKKIKIPIKSKQQQENELKMQKQENARVVKWKQMLDKYPFKVHAKLKSRGRKGIPDSFRGFAWCLLTDAHSVSKEKKTKSEISKYMENLIQAEGNLKLLGDIHKDVSRTLPNHIYFQSKFKHG